MPGSLLKEIEKKMKTQLEKTFEVPQGSDLVWEHLIDPNKVMDCVPGVSIDEKVGENHYRESPRNFSGGFRVN